MGESNKVKVGDFGNSRLLSAVRRLSVSSARHVPSVLTKTSGGSTVAESQMYDCLYSVALRVRGTCVLNMLHVLVVLHVVC